MAEPRFSSATGINGARLPTGQNNVRAEYRKGGGLGGLVEAGQISQLLSRPLGLKEVVNPRSTPKAQRMPSRATTRARTLRSLCSPSIARCRCRTTKTSRAPLPASPRPKPYGSGTAVNATVFITVAGPDGASLDEKGAVIAMLKEALRTYGDPFVAFTVKNFRKVLFQSQGTVTIHPDHVIDTVMAAVTADLRDRYSFDARAFGQSGGVERSHRHDAIGAPASSPSISTSFIATTNRRRC